MSSIQEAIEGGKFKSYIGDSVYANFDGYNIILTTENGLRYDPSNRIALEPHVLNSLFDYKVQLEKRLKQFTEVGP